MHTNKHRALLLIGILMVAATLRAPFTGVAPVLDMISNSFALTTAQTGLLTTIPLLAFALVSPFVAPVVRRYGTEPGLLAALIIICAGIALRSAGSLVWLYTGTALIGCGIAMGNVLLPSLVKRDYPQSIAKVTGVYSLTMGIAAAAGSVLVVPVAHYGFGWSGALLALMIFPLLAILCWLPHLRQVSAAQVGGNPALKNSLVWRSPLAWQVTLFLGINSFIYYVIVGWLPSVLVSYGYSDQQAGSLHGVLQLATAVPGLVIGVILSRLKDQRAIAVLMGLLWFIALCGMVWYPPLATLWIAIGGFGSGAGLILGLSFIALRTGSAHQAATLSGMAQCIGYLLAAAGPPLIGKVHDLADSWSAPLLICAGLALLMAAFGARAGRPIQLQQ